jgi:chaperonin cofactor prefoldin
MSTKQTDANTTDIELRLQKLEKRVATLEKRAGKLNKRTRRTREYTPEEKAAIRARLVAGQEAARKRRETANKETS